jgi:hypothetical protein
MKNMIIDSLIEMLIILAIGIPAILIVNYLLNLLGW